MRLEQRPGQGNAHKLIAIFLALLAWSNLFWSNPGMAQDETTGCVPGGSKSYQQFASGDFSYMEDTLEINDNGYIVLETGRRAINKEKLLMTSTQEVKVSLLFEGGGYESHFGYFLLSKAQAAGYVNANGSLNYSLVKSHIQPNDNFDMDSYDSNTFHYLFRQMKDNDNSSDDGGDGVLDTFMVRNALTSTVTSWIASNPGKTAEDFVGQYDDGTSYPFDVNGDGQLTARDMTKNLGLIAEGEEIVFFLVANRDYNNIFFNKTSYNPDTYTSTDCTSSSTINKIYHLGQARTGSGCRLDSGWLSEAAVDRLNTQFGITLNSTDLYLMQIRRNQKYPHLIVGAPADDPTQWILGWEDLQGGGDTDHNDMVFKVQRKTDGRAISTVLSEAIVALPNTYITAVDIEAQDYAVNCVSGVVSAANITFSNENFAGDWDYTYEECDPTSHCSVGCDASELTGSLTMSNLILSGDIDKDFVSANLSAQAGASTQMSFSSCHRPEHHGSHCRDRTTHNSFSNSSTSVNISGNAISVDSNGAFSGSFTISGQINAENSDNETCFQDWAGTLNKTVTLSGQLNGDWNTRKNDIRYFISVDDGQVWVEVTNWDSIILNDDRTRTKKARIDILSLGLVGNQLRWKAVFESNDDHCTPPEIHRVDIAYDASGNNFFSRGDPIVQGNVLYSGSFETPAASWTDKTKLRGHVKAYRIYDPNNPNQPDYTEIWDAGEQLAQRNLSNDPRRILVAMPTPISVPDLHMATGDGHTINFSGALQNGRILADTLTITDGIETFSDTGVNVLTGDKGGSGTINRFTGDYSITFIQPPVADVPIVASYTYYPNTSNVEVLGDFNTDYISDSMLGITDEYAEGAGYTYDFNEDGAFDDGDKIHLIKWVQGFTDGTGQTEKEWPLDAIDHSTPAIAGPPALPAWYYGIDISQQEREAFDTWAHLLKDKRAVLYVGSRNGMLHAFDAGAFRHGDNPATGFMEHRGYFASSDGSVDYGTGAELWAFIPNNCLSRLKFHANRALANADPPYVDASPSLEDVFYKEGNQTAFKTVLFSAEGNGGDTVFALDVTDPHNPVFMWEFGDPALWRSKSSPPIGKIARLNAAGEAKWVVFFVSGQTDLDQHPSVFMVDAISGTLLRRITLDGPGTANLGAVLSGSPAILDANGNGYVDRFYVGDNKGYIYRINIPDDSSSTLDLEDIQDCVLVKVSQPIYASPAVYPQNTYDSQGYVSSYHVKIMFGTGDNPYSNDNPNYGGTLYKFYVFDDVCGPLDSLMISRDSLGMECSCSQMQTEADAEWTYTLPVEHRVWAEAFAAAGTVYFGTATTDTEDPCSVPTVGTTHGNLYSLDLSSLPSQPTLVSGDIGNVVGIMVEDEHLYVKTNKPQTGTNLNSFGSGNYNNEVGVGVSFNTSKVPGSWRQVIP